MRPLSFVLGILLLLAPLAGAQVVLPEKGREAGLLENVFGLGVAAGPATGLGLSFRHHLPSSLSYQVTGGIIKVDNRLSASIGGNVQYDLARGASSRFFVGGGLGYFFSGRSGNNDMKAPARLGLGIGGEMAAATEIHATLELMFTYFTDGTILPLPQIGFHYYFY